MGDCKLKISEHPTSNFQLLSSISHLLSPISYLREKWLDGVEAVGAFFLEEAAETINFWRDGGALAAMGPAGGVAGGGAAEHAPGMPGFQAGQETIEGGGDEVERQIELGDVVPGKQDVVAATAKIGERQVAPGGFQMIDGIGRAEADDKAGAEEAQAEVAFLAHVEEMLAITARGEKH